MKDSFVGWVKPGVIIKRRKGLLLNLVGCVLFMLLGAVLLGVQLLIFGVLYPDFAAQQILNGLQMGFIYALLALGYSLVYGLTNVVNFAQGGIFLAGAGASFYAVTALDLHRWMAWFWPETPAPIIAFGGLVTLLLLSMSLSALLSVALNHFVLRPLQNKPRSVVLLMLIGVALFFEGIGRLLFSRHEDQIFYPQSFAVVGPDGQLPLWLLVLAWSLFAACLVLFGSLIWKVRRGNIAAQSWRCSPLTRFGLLFSGAMLVILTALGLAINSTESAAHLRVSHVMLITVGGSIVLQVLVQFLVTHTRFGKALRAIACDAEAARLMGIDVERISTLTFALAGSLAGAAGAFYALAFGMQPLLGGIPALKALAAAVTGGLGGIPASLVGGLIVGLVEALADGVLCAPLVDMLVFSLLLLVLLLRPRGIFGASPEHEDAGGWGIAKIT